MDNDTDQIEPIEPIELAVASSQTLGANGNMTDFVRLLETTGFSDE